MPAGPFKPWSVPPRFDTDEQNQFAAWIVSAVNQLTSQGINPPGNSGLQALQNKQIDPTSSQIISAGSRTSALTTTSVVSNGVSSSITFLWDGSGGSQVFRIGRDDGTIYGPNPAGSPFAVSGLTGGVTYFFYPYFDESLQAIRFAQVVGVSVGNPAVAYTAQNFKAAQQQMLRGHIPLCSIAGSQGIAIPGGAGTTNVDAGSGGSGGGQLGGDRTLL